MKFWKFGKKGLGKAGEDLACAFLKRKGYKIIERNYRTPIGEIDIVAKDKDTLVFVEVKTRSQKRFGLPKEAVSKVKQKRLIRLAQWYLKGHNLPYSPKVRFDVVGISIQDKQYECELIKGAFGCDN